MLYGQADASGHELFVGTKVVDEGRIEIRGELPHLCEAHLPQDKPAGQRLTEAPQLVDVERSWSKGLARIPRQLARIPRGYQVVPRGGGGNDHIPGFEQREEQR